VDRITDDHDGLALESAAGVREGAVHRDPRKLVAVGGIAPEGPEWKVPVVVGRFELQPRAGLEIAGQQPERHGRFRGETREQHRDAGLRNHRARNQAAFELREVELEGAREPALEALRADVGGDQLPDDLRVGLAREVPLAAVLVLFGGLPTEGFLKRLQDRVPCDLPRGQERTVDVEEDEPVAVRSCIRH